MSDVRLIAIYFPQLHAIPENDRWWGAGFTDWVNVKRARPLYPGHYQPRVPRDGYYDQSDARVVRRQVQTAREYGLGGFCHYHYWFEGKQLLQRPTELFLQMKDLDFPFCLSWANETWSRRWDGQEHQILQLQRHPPTKEAWGAHFDYLIRAWTDPRAIRVDGKPLFMIYRPDKIERPGEMFDYWQTRARAHGLDGLYFVAVSQYKTPAWDVLRHFDALFRFQPAVATTTRAEANPPFYKRHFAGLRAMVPRPLAIRLQSAIDRLNKQTTVLDYDEIWRHIVEQPVDRALTTFEGAFVDWDNTARYGERATVYQGAQPERFQYWLERLVAKVCTNNRPEERLIFINAWNEWAESAYLEPDERHGDAWLRAVRAVADGAGRDAVGNHARVVGIGGRT